MEGSSESSQWYALTQSSIKIDKTPIISGVTIMQPIPTKTIILLMDCSIVNILRGWPPWTL